MGNTAGKTATEVREVKTIGKREAFENPWKAGKQSMIEKESNASRVRGGEVMLPADMYVPYHLESSEFKEQPVNDIRRQAWAIRRV